MGARVVTAREILDEHAALDIECLDRVYLNAYVPVLQSSGQVVAFTTQHLGLPTPAEPVSPGSKAVSAASGGCPRGEPDQSSDASSAFDHAYHS